jgi:hypothetical protein
MKIYKLDNMVKGWFIGNFHPSVFYTNAFEVAVKRYKQGDSESRHYHRIATEFTVVVSGRVRMIGRVWSDGDIIMLEPGEQTDFVAITDAIITVVKIPSSCDDKVESIFIDASRDQSGSTIS